MGRGAHWTREELSTLEKQLAEGKSAYQISKETGWSYSSVKHKLSAMKASSEPLERKRRSVTTEALTSAKTSLQAKPKQSCKDVAKQVGCSRSYAWKLMHHELKMRPLKQVRQPRLTEANKAIMGLFFVCVFFASQVKKKKNQSFVCVLLQEQKRDLGAACFCKPRKKPKFCVCLAPGSEERFRSCVFCKRRKKPGFVCVLLQEQKRDLGAVCFCKPRKKTSFFLCFCFLGCWPVLLPVPLAFSSA